MTPDRCDFEIPPSQPGWYGVLCSRDSWGVWAKAVYWTGSEWRDYPKLAYARSTRGFETEDAVRDWLAEQRD
jgi:hypothetical protein